MNGDRVARFAHGSPVGRGISPTADGSDDMQLPRPSRRHRRVRVLTVPVASPASRLTLEIDETLGRLLDAYRTTKSLTSSQQARLAVVSRLGHYDLDGCTTTTAESVSPQSARELRAAQQLADALLERVPERRLRPSK